MWSKQKKRSYHSLTLAYDLIPPFLCPPQPLHQIYVTLFFLFHFFLSIRKMQKPTF